MVPDAVRLLVARHGETRDNAAGRWQGWNDSALTPQGIAQAEALARRLAGEPVAAVYASDLGRAAHTARIVAARHGLAVESSPALRERNVGIFAGLTGPEVEARYPAALSQRSVNGVLDWAPPEGESFRHMLARATVPGECQARTRGTGRPGRDARRRHPLAGRLWRR